MTITISSELETNLVATAQDRHISVDSLVHDIIRGYFDLSPELADEFAAWEQVSDEALELVDKLVQS